MRTSQTSIKSVPAPNWNKLQGFTLLEIILVVTLIGLISSIAVIGYGSINREAKELEREVGFFHYLISDLVEQSVFEGKTFGIGLDEEFFRTYELDYNSSGQKPFRVIGELPLDSEYSITFVDEHQFDNTTLYTESWVQSLETSYSTEDEEPETEPVIQIFAGGQVVPFKLRIAFAGYEEPEIFLRVNSLGKVTIENNEEQE